MPFELLFQITMCGGATGDARQFYGQIVSEIEAVIDSYVRYNRRDAEKVENVRTGWTMNRVGISEKISASPRLGGEDLPSVADSLFATSRIYSLFQNISPENSQEAESDNTEEKTEFAYDAEFAGSLDRRSS